MRQPRTGERITVVTASGGVYTGRVTRKFRGYNLTLETEGGRCQFGKYFGPDWRIVKWEEAR